MTPLPKHIEEMRQYWIDTEDKDIEDNYAGNAMYEHPKQGPPIWQLGVVHVIEVKAIDLMLKDLESMEKAIVNYAYGKNMHTGEAKEALEEELENYYKKYEVKK